MQYLMWLLREHGIDTPYLLKFITSSKICLDERWVTTENGNRVLLSNSGEIKAGFGGKFTGQNVNNIAAEGEANSMLKNENDAKKLNAKIDILKSQGIVSENIGIAEAPVSIQIESVNNHAAKRMAERGITESDAQSYIDNAMVMLVQNNDERRLYISGDGNSAVLIEGRKLLSAYPSQFFDEGVRRIIEEVRKYG